MPIDRVKFSGKYPTGSYLNMDVGFEWSIEPGEDPLQVLYKLMELGEQAHREKYPHMYTESGSPVTVRSMENGVGDLSNGEDTQNVKIKLTNKMPADKAIMKKYVSAVAAGDQKTIEKLKSQYDIKFAGNVTESPYTESGQDTQ